MWEEASQVRITFELMWMRQPDLGLDMIGMTKLTPVPLCLMLFESTLHLQFVLVVRQTFYLSFIWRHWCILHFKQCKWWYQSRIMMIFPVRAIAVILLQPLIFFWGGGWGRAAEKGMMMFTFSYEFQNIHPKNCIVFPLGEIPKYYKTVFVNIIPRSYSAQLCLGTSLFTIFKHFACTDFWAVFHTELYMFLGAMNLHAVSYR